MRPRTTFPHLPRSACAPGSRRRWASPTSMRCRDNAREAFLQFLAANWLTVTVAGAGGIIAGWAAREKMDEEITDLWVDPAMQRRGIGTALLLAALEDEMRRSGFETADLQTHARNAPALAFFRKHGYAVNWLSVTYSPKLDRDVGIGRAASATGRGSADRLRAGRFLIGPIARAAGPRSKVGLTDRRSARRRVAVKASARSVGETSSAPRSRRSPMQAGRR